MVPLPTSYARREELLKRIALAAIAGAHGIKGELRLKLFTGSVENLRLYDQLYVGGAPRRLLSVGHSGKTPTASFEGICGRSGAEALRGTLIEVDRSALPPLEEGEYYHADLIGLPAEDRQGNLIGTVIGVENYGAGDLLDIEEASGKRSLIPFRSGIADLKDGRFVIDRQFLA